MKSAEMKIIRFDGGDVIATSGAPILAGVFKFSGAFDDSYAETITYSYTDGSTNGSATVNDTGVGNWDGDVPDSPFETTPNNAITQLIDEIEAHGGTGLEKAKLTELVMKANFYETANGSPLTVDKDADGAHASITRTDGQDKINFTGTSDTLGAENITIADVLKSRVGNKLEYSASRQDDFRYKNIFEENPLYYNSNLSGSGSASPDSSDPQQIEKKVDYEDGEIRYTTKTGNYELDLYDESTEIGEVYYTDIISSTETSTLKSTFDAAEWVLQIAADGSSAKFVKSN